MDFDKLAGQLGRGILFGLGLGTSAYGGVLLYAAFAQQAELNIGALVATLAGGACLLMAVIGRRQE